MLTAYLSTEQRSGRMGWCEASAQRGHGNDGVVVQRHGCDAHVSAPVAPSGAGGRLQPQQELESAQKMLSHPQPERGRASM